MDHLVDKADLTPSPLIGSGSNKCFLTGETNYVVSVYVFALAEPASVTFLIPRRNHCNPLVMELSGIEPLSEVSVEIT